MSIDFAIELGGAGYQLRDKARGYKLDWCFVIKASDEKAQLSLHCLSMEALVL